MTKKTRRKIVMTLGSFIMGLGAAVVGTAYFEQGFDKGAEASSAVLEKWLKEGKLVVADKEYFK